MLPRMVWAAAMEQKSVTSKKTGKQVKVTFTAYVLTFLGWLHDFSLFCLVSTHYKLHYEGSQVIFQKKVTFLAFKN